MFKKDFFRGSGVGMKVWVRFWTNSSRLFRILCSGLSFEVFWLHSMLGGPRWLWRSSTASNEFVLKDWCRQKCFMILGGFHFRITYDGIMVPRRWIESICYSIYFLFRMNGEGAQRIAALMQSCWTLSGSIPQEFISSRRTLTFPSWNVTMHSQLWAPFYSSRPVAILPIARPFSHTFNFARQPPQLSARQPFQLWWIRSPLFFFWPAPGRIVGIVDWVGMRRRHWECPVGPVGPVDGRDARELWELSRGMPGRGRRGEGCLGEGDGEVQGDGWPW